MALTPESSTSAARPFVEIRPLIRALALASDGKKLLLAIIGLLTYWAGERLLVGPSVSGLWLSLPFLPPGFDGVDHWEGVIPLGSLIVEPVRVVVVPLARLFSRGVTPGSWFLSAALALWGVVVWGIFGGAMTRIAVVQAAGDHRVGLLAAFRFSLRKSASLIGAPLTPLFGVALFAGACAVFGLISRIPGGVGSTFATVFGFVPLGLGIVMSLILIGLALGWPLMIATVATEGEDAPDALSRSYSYVNQRLVRYAIHVVISGVIGVIGLVLVIAFARVVIGLADWGVGLGGGTVLESPTSSGITWVAFVGLVVHAWVYSYFWSAASVVYLILRRDVDGTTWHDVYLSAHDADTFAGDLDPRATEPRAVVETTEIG